MSLADDFRVSMADRARRRLAEFFKQAVQAGQIEGLTKLEWGKHLDALCSQIQLQLEAWMVSYGYGTPDMVARQKAAWERTGAVWEDKLPNPWERYVLVTSALDNAPPGTLKSSIAMICAPAWVWLTAPKFSFGALSGIDANVGRDSRACRDLVRSDWYRETFEINWSTVDMPDPTGEPGDDPDCPDRESLEIAIKRDADAVDVWATTAGGKRISRTITRGLTGTHVDCVVGETLVATELGDVAIEELVAMEPMPRVWSWNHETDRAELAEVVAWRRIECRQTVDVLVDSGHVLRCTDDHRVYTAEGYKKASEATGSSVSVMRWAEPAGEYEQTAELPKVRQGHVDLRNVRGSVPALGLRSCEGEEAGQGRKIRLLLLEEMPTGQSIRPGSDPRMQVREDFQTTVAARKPQVLFSGMCSAILPTAVRGQAVRHLWKDDADNVYPKKVLQSTLCQQGSLQGDEGSAELELPARSRQALPVRHLAPYPAAHSREGRVLLCGMRVDSEGTEAKCPPYRRKPVEQCTREPHHAVPDVPHAAPQSARGTVLSADPSPEVAGRREHTVYDIEVAGTHNFFANGILVHNCIFLDDPDDADKVYNEADRLRPQNRWTRVIETRVNDEHRSIRRVLQQVVHPEGMTAYLLSIARWSPQNPKGWDRLCIPAEYGFGPEDAPKETAYGWKDWRTVRGETMHPRLSPGVLADKRLKLPGYEGQFNQNPKALTDGMFERRHSRFFVWDDERPELLRRRPDGCPQRNDYPPIVVRRDELDRWTLSVDAANKRDPKPGDKVSAVGLIVGACRKEDRFTVDDRTRVLGISATYKAIFETLRMWQIERVLVEVKAMGEAVITELMLAIRRGWWLDAETDEEVLLLGPDGKPVKCEVEPVNPGKDTKPQRAHAMLPDWEAGRHFLHDGADWLYPKTDESRKTMDEGYIGEKCSFPGSRRNDRVDAESQFMARYRTVAPDAKAKVSAMKRLALVASRRG